MRTTDRDGPMFGTATDDDLAEIVHAAMCSGEPYRDRCRRAARKVRAALGPDDALLDVLACLLDGRANDPAYPDRAIVYAADVDALSAWYFAIRQEG